MKGGGVNQKLTNVKSIYLFFNEGFPKTRTASVLPSFHGGQVYYDGDCKYSCNSDGSCKTELLVDWANFANSESGTSITTSSKCTSSRTSKFCFGTVSGCSNCNQIMDCEADYHDYYKDGDETYEETLDYTCTILKENTLDDCTSCHGTVVSRNGQYNRTIVCSSASVPITTLTALVSIQNEYNIDFLNFFVSHSIRRQDKRNRQ